MAHSSISELAPNPYSISDSSGKMADIISGSPASSDNFQSVDDFMKERAEEEAAAGLANKPPSSLAKKKKRIVDIAGLTAEVNAMDEIGDTNWIGKLNGKYAFHFISRSFD